MIRRLGQSAASDCDVRQDNGGESRGILKHEHDSRPPPWGHKEHGSNPHE